METLKAELNDVKTKVCFYKRKVIFALDTVQRVQYLNKVVRECENEWFSFT